MLLSDSNIKDYFLTGETRLFPIPTSTASGGGCFKIVDGAGDGLADGPAQALMAEKLRDGGGSIIRCCPITWDKKSGRREP